MRQVDIIETFLPFLLHRQEKANSNRARSFWICCSLNDSSQETPFLHLHPYVILITSYWNNHIFLFVATLRMMFDIYTVTRSLYIVFHVSDYATLREDPYLTSNRLPRYYEICQLGMKSAIKLITLELIQLPKSLKDLDVRAKCLHRIVCK